jgi:hypothetical protein
MVVFLAGATALAGQPSPSIPPRAPTPDAEVDRLLMRLAPVPLRHSQPITTLTFAADGRTVTTVSDAEAAVFLWDGLTGKVLQRRRLPLGRLEGSSLSGNGQLLAAAGPGGAISLWQARTCKQLRLFEGARGPSLVLSADGKYLAAADTDTGQCAVWDTATGKLSRLLIRSAGLSAQALALSRDGKTVAAGRPDGSIGLWDAVTGKERHSLPAGTPDITLLTFAPDGKVLASCDATGRLRLWEVASGRERRQITVPSGQRLACCLFSPDGRALLTGGADNTLRLWEVASGKERQRFPILQAPVTCAALTPDGKTLAVAAEDQLALVRDASAPGAAGGLEGAPRQPVPLEALWSDLAGADAVRAYRAVGLLVARPAEAVPFLKGRLRPVPAPDRADVLRLIRDLNSDVFATRQKAMRALEVLSEMAEADLEAALKADPPAEVRRRLQTLLKRVKVGRPNPEWLRAVRAIEALELAGTREARQLLRQVAAWTPEDRLSRQAEAALGRLQERSARRP